MSIPSTSLEPAVAAWTALLGADGCIPGSDSRAEAYRRDLGEYRPRAIATVLYPRSAVDVQAVVRVANAHRIPLYSVSAGKNWGLGSRQPVQDGVVVDLGRMDRVRAVDVDEGHAIVEPGVTQRALSEALASTPWIANFTASTPETSVVGNLLDKGIGLHRHRVDDAVGIEVVTGYGELAHVGGYWPMGRTAFHFPSGLGPTLTPLFLQSNFGIVTACVLKLIPRPEMLEILYATVAADRLPEALRALKRLRAEHALTAVIKLYNAHAFHAYSGRTAAADDRRFHVVAALHGSAAWVRHLGPFVTGALREAQCFDDIAMLGQDGLTRAPELVQALARTLAGTPDRFAVQRALGLEEAAQCDDPDRLSRKGLIFIIPVVPLTSGAIGDALDVLGGVSKRYGVPINSTINIVSERAVEMVSSILFSRTPDEIAGAHALKRGLIEELDRHGIPLMKLDIDSQHGCQIFAEATYRELLVRLKRAFDPNDIIAPGRYVPQG